MGTMFRGSLDANLDRGRAEGKESERTTLGGHVEGTADGLEVGERIRCIWEGIIISIQYRRSGKEGLQ